MDPLLYRKGNNNLGQKLNYILFTVSNSGYFKEEKEGLWLWSSGYKAGATDSFPGRGTKILYAVGQLSLRALEPVRPATVCRLQSPCAATGEAHALQLKKALVLSRGSSTAKTKEMQVNNNTGSKTILE